MSTLHDSYVFYSYWDVNGDGIDPQHLVTYKDSIIFDTYNRTIYARGDAFGNHQFGTYHGEIFNDFENNGAYGDYSSAHGYNVHALNDYEFGIGSYNDSVEGKTLFTVGDGTAEERHNIFEANNDGTAYVRGHLFTEKSSSEETNTTTAYIDTAYSNVSYDEESHVETSYTELSYVNTSYTELSYTTYSYSGLLYSDISYSDISYSETAYAKASYVDVSYVGEENVGYVLTRVPHMFPALGSGFYNGQYYIWIGTESDLPEPEDRYKNVIYIVAEEVPDTDLPIFEG